MRRHDRINCNPITVGRIDKGGFKGDSQPEEELQTKRNHSEHFAVKVIRQLRYG